jgi:hypothetical protein
MDDECVVDPREAESSGEDVEQDDGEGQDMEEDSDQLYLDQPDVLEYLDQWNIPTVDKISMLRTAANYLTTRAKAENPDLRGKRLK